MKRILLVLFCLVAFPVMASHIVGGEFEIIHISGNTYRVNMILYFDQIYGNPGARDAQVVARIFRMRDNFVMRNVTLPLFSEDNVSYTQPECSDGEIVTSRIVYTTTIEMTPEEYSDPEGYYISWERCCRNYTITNIYSQDPMTGGQYAGQTFYLEFPPVVKDGQPFINSTPRLFPPLNDYACPDRPYYVDFAGIDDDGDSLVYSLVTPMNTKTADALPPGNVPRPRPYPDVVWREPFGPHNILGGEPDLKISEDGFLTVTPTLLGLYVFAVKCEEFRDGVKIGEVRRDFQMLVIECKDQAVAPQILGKTSSELQFDHDENMTVNFSSAVADEDRCIQVQVSDNDSFNDIDGYSENISIRAVALNFKKDMTGILPSVTSATLSHGSTRVFDICFDKCPPFEGGAFQVGIVAYDDACALPLSDTLKILVNVEPPANAKPEFITPNVEITLSEGESMEWDIEGVDADRDPLIIGIVTDGFSLADVGMALTTVEHDSGVYRAKLAWDTRCNVYDFTQKTSFDLRILMEDVDECSLARNDTMVFKLNVLLPGNDLPLIATDLSPEELEHGVTRKIFEPLGFNVFGSDEDNDLLVLAGNGKDFAFGDHGMSFPQVTANGFVSSHFGWSPDCGNVNLALKDYFELEFIVIDSANKCGFFKSASLTVKVNVAPPDNQPPVLTVANANPALPFENHQQSLQIGDQISLMLTAEDPDSQPYPDQVRIDLGQASGNVDPTGYVFTPATGIKTAHAAFTWKPDCSIFSEGVYENNYTFTFISRDDRCFSAAADTVTVDFRISDLENGSTSFIPPNVVTPNGDSRNEFFAMVKENKATMELESILPLDNCLGHFVSIVIYNRWGAQVFESQDRDFRWYPESEAAGVYFYTLRYSDKEYKGSISLRN